MKIRKAPSGSGRFSYEITIPQDAVKRNGWEIGDEIVVDWDSQLALGPDGSRKPGVKLRE